MIIHCVGDSHANFFSGFDVMQPEWPAPGIKNRIPQLRSYRIGPALAYNLCEYGTSSRGRERLEQLLDCLEPGDHLLFCFGEIDCRAHVIRQSEWQQRLPEDIIGSIVERYLSVILAVRAKGYRPLVWNVIPSAPTDINERITVPLQFLFHGSREERNRVTRLFNSELQRVATLENIPFIDIFDDLLAKDGTVDQSFYSDEIHLSQKAMPITLRILSNIFGESFSCDKSIGENNRIYYSTVPCGHSGVSVTPLSL